MYLHTLLLIIIIIIWNIVANRTEPFALPFQQSELLQCLAVLHSARTMLIFTRSQEGTQSGELTQTGQTEQGIRYRVPSCWVPGRGSWAGGEGESSCGSGACGASGGESCSLHFAICFIYSSYQYCCCYCLFPLLFC